MIPLHPLPSYRSPGTTSHFSATVSEERRNNITTELENGVYDCIVCTESLYPTSDIWACPSCCNLFHHDCVSKWAKQRPRGAWPCPTCKAMQPEPSMHAKCWCGKMEKNSLRLNGLHDGNSCYQVCGKKHVRGFEEGTCEEICHPGACGEVFYRTVLPRRPKPYRNHGSRGRENVASQDPESPFENGNENIQQDRNLNWYQRLAERWREDVNSDTVHLAVTCLVFMLLMIGFETLWAFQRAEKMNQPLRHQEYTDSDYAETGDFFANLFLGIPLLVLPSFVSSLGLGLAMDHILTILFQLRRNSMKRWILRVVFFLFTAGTLATFMVLQVLVPEVTWENQFKHGCDGFDTHVVLDHVVGEGRASYTKISDSIQLRPLHLDNLPHTSPGLNTFNFSTPHDLTKSKDAPFSNLHRMLGQTPTHTLAVDFDLHHHTWRILDLSPSQIHPMPSLQHTSVQADSMSNVLKNGTWTQTSLWNPHLLLPELKLLIPAFRHFSRNNKYQPFMKVYDISGMDKDRIEEVKWRQWSGKNEEGVAMRTHANSHSPSSSLRVCYKRGEMDGKALGDDALVPLGLMAVMRIQSSKDVD
ncbi:hypothetical protein HYALB_00008410 [Hymenoscyphus albidus]|uniref:RING-type domain-containing protein n=1 Tax=Hymenoscyphus albidus TaxID=595503 RepID=A0A9N9LQB9_9HELO|nr:hypothetical protein HYALB_00008410 [Hymenoscyphus albidus]